MAHEELKKYVFRTASFYVVVRICEGIYVETGILFTKTSQNLDEIKLENHWAPKIRCIQFFRHFTLLLWYKKAWESRTNL